MHHAGAESAVKQTAYIGLGANLGARGETMRAALRALAELSFVQIDCVSSFYETPPWGKIDQPPFLNAAACVSFAGAPHSLIGEMQRIERELGRVRREHWGARTIDLDLLYVDGVTTSDDVLTLPHPYLTERAFVLVPLAEIAPDLTVRGRAVSAWLQHADASGIVRAPELPCAAPPHPARRRGRGGRNRARRSAARPLPRGHGVFPQTDDGRNRCHGAEDNGEPAGAAAARGTGEYCSVANA